MANASRLKVRMVATPAGVDPIIAAYSPQMLTEGIEQLQDSVTGGRATEWERNRLAILKAEHSRRCSALDEEGGSRA